MSFSDFLSNSLQYKQKEGNFLENCMYLFNEFEQLRLGRSRISQQKDVDVSTTSQAIWQSATINELRMDSLNECTFF